MGDVKHTPGPWWIAGKITIRSGKKGTHSEGWIGSVNWRNREANARLIAAAPDLLAELTRMVECARIAGITLGNMDAARAAIARATEA